jgi:hypothetical protein
MSNSQPINFNDVISKALQDNPHLRRSPALASDAIKSSNPTDTAPLLSHSANMSGVQQAAQDYVAENPQPTHWWDGIVHSATNALESLAKPLKEVQRDYKYIHSLYTRHGVFTGLLGTLAIAGGAVVGTFAGGPAGTVIGADLAGAALRKIGGNMEEYRNSYADSENENYKVSMGRDVANLLGAHGQTDTGWGKFVSGSVDMAADISLDPLMKLGALSKTFKSGQFLTESGKFTPWAFRSAGAQEFLARNSLRMYSADQAEKVYQAGLNANSASFTAGRQYHRALEQLVGMTEGDIVAKFPELQGSAARLGQVNRAAEAFGATREEAVDSLHKAFMETQFHTDFMAQSAVGGLPVLPSRSVARAVLGKSSEKLRQPFADSLDDTAYDFRNAANFIIPRFRPNGEGGKQFVAPLVMMPFSKKTFASAMAKKIRTFSGYQPYAIDSKTLDLSTKTFKPDDPGALQGIYRVMRFSMGDRLARDITSDYANAISRGDIGAARTIYVDGIHSMFKAAGLPNDTKAAEEILDHMHMSGQGSISSQHYGYGFHTGNDASVIADADKTVPAALWSHQVGEWSFPNFNEVKLAMRSMGNIGKVYGHIDEFTAKNWTNSIFKPLALLTTGFGLRISASELIPTFIRYGAIETAKAKVSGAAAKMNYKLAAGEDEHIMSNALLALAGGGSMKDFLANEASVAGVESKKAAQKVYDDLLAKSEDPLTADSVTKEDLANALAKVKAIKNPRIRKTVAKGLGKVANEDDLELASQIAIATNGHMATGATMAGHGTDLDFTERQKQLMHYLGQQVRAPKTINPDGTFSQYSAHNQDFDIHWLMSNQKASQNVSAQSIAKDVLRLVKSGKSQEEAWSEAAKLEESRIIGVDHTTGSVLNPMDDLYASERATLSRYTGQESAKFAFDRTDDLRNTVTGGDGTFHEDLLQKIANREKVSIKQLANIDSAAKPSSIIGPELMPYVGPNLLNRIIQNGFKKIIDPIVGGLSRQPLFFLHAKEAMSFYRPMIEAGKISEETGLRFAMTRATHAMLPQIHNVALRTQFSVLAQNFLPFYFAQEQAIKRYIKLGTDNPEALRAYQLIEHGMNDPGFVQTDDQGNKYVTFPFIGELGAGVMNAATKLGMPVIGNLPLTVRGDTKSLKTVLPEFTPPGTSPFFNLAANTITAFFPELARPIKSTIGMGYGQSAIDTLIPNTVARSWFKALNANEQDSTFHSAMLSALAAANYHNQLPDQNASPAEKQAFIDRIKNNARSILVMKGILGAVSPLAPQLSQEDPGLRDEFYKLVKAKNDYPTALHEFLGRHGDKAISYTVARSEGTIKGANVPYTDQAINWIQDNEALLKSNFAVGAAFLVPQEPGLSGDKRAIYDEVIKMHLRSKRTPEEFMDAIYSSAGSNQYFANKKLHDDAIAAAGDNSDQVKAENTTWSSWVKNYKLANPIWADDFESPEKRNIAKRSISDLTTLFNSGKLVETDQTKLVRGLLQDYYKHEDVKNIIRGYRVETTLSDENANWETYLNTLSEKEPRLTTIINGVFRRLQ